MPKRKPIKKIETIEEYLARDGQITILPPQRSLYKDPQDDGANSDKKGWQKFKFGKKGKNQ
jgi:hypothetical protein